MPNAKKTTLSIRLDPDLHEAVRHLAYKRRRSINNLITEWIDQGVVANALTTAQAEELRKLGSE